VLSSAAVAAGASVPADAAVALWRDRALTTLVLV